MIFIRDSTMIDDMFSQEIDYNMMLHQSLIAPTD